ncbi:adenosylcobinamide-phosphate synthase CbiB [Plasticicumulans sp.]|uniref:adenosylcobinamide-phosphate synthase CbiB n=4 Tax=Plasticicumulans sp. TaxID=2307179 RepID=UPI00321FA23F
MPMSSVSATVLVPALAYLLDRLLGEPPLRWHPLVWFGRWAGALERRLYRDSIRRGGLVWMLAVLPPTLLAGGLGALPGFGPWLGAGLLMLALGARSLDEHAQAVAVPLAAGELPAARQQLARIVSRDTATLDETGIARAAVESVLENGNDAICGALFWYALAGPAGAVGYRLANTLDAMWGYRTARHERFGKVAARIDDALNWLPARLCAASYALAGDARTAWHCWRTQARHWDSPNAGPVMAAGAGALGLALGGPASYGGHLETRPALGAGRAPRAAGIGRACALVRRASGLWVLLAMLSSGLRG